MIELNQNYKKLQADYLFVEIARRVANHLADNPGRDIIKLGIGDVTRPLAPSVIRAFHEGVQDQATMDGFHGYGPEQGYAFLREVIAEMDFNARGCGISPDEVFISDGSKCDTSNFQELFSTSINVAIPDPVYPVYVDTNVMAGRSGDFRDGRYENLIYVEGSEDNGFVPSPQSLEQADLVYLCFPNNPTGIAATKAQLAEWVEWAISTKALILFDAAYEAFITDESIPRSIYEIPGAENCAIEFRSFSKSCGFTGTRCAYTVVPASIVIDGVKIRDLWSRRQATKFNGVSYPVQRAATAAYSPEGRKETKETIDYYLGNAQLIRSGMQELGFTVWGGLNSPYVWIKTGENSWAMFDTMLREADVVVTPGSGFGRMGEGYIRISAFNSRSRIQEAVTRITAVWRDKKLH